MNWEAVTTELSKKLDPAHVKKPSGSFGPKGDYIEGWHAIAEANAIFGFGGWSYTITGLTQDRLSEGKDSRGNVQWQAAYTCIVKVVVGEVVRQDVGFGSGFAKQPGDAIEGATKEAVTDALKRALRTFGNRFGLALYDKSRENVGRDEPPFDSAGACQRIKDTIAKRHTLAELSELWSAEKDTLQALTDAHFNEVKQAFADRKAALTPPDPAGQAPEGFGQEVYQ